MDFTVPYPSPAITGRNCDTTSPNIRKPEKDRTFLIFLVVFSPKVIAKESSADRKQSPGVLKTNRKSICSEHISEKLLAAVFF